ncbi:MAG TPA: protein TolA [Xanthobacteraceae bacterium]|jgi:colicin import membrane protein|nr:protein TolA [Xanthobacteraceae bacterium]
MKRSFAISLIVHATFLLWGLISFSAAPLKDASTETMPIDVISAKEFSELRAGARNAPKAETPKPFVEKVGEAKPVEDPLAKLVEKTEVAATASVMPPEPQPKPPEPKPAPAPAEAKSEPKPKEPEKKEPEQKPDPVAEALKKEQQKKPEPKKEEPKKEDAKKPEPKKDEAKVAPPKKPEPVKQQPKFDATRIATLLDKRDPQRHAATGDAINNALALGTTTSNAPQLSASEIDAFRSKLKSCWSPPVGSLTAEKVVVPITIRLKPDRTLAGNPVVEISARDAYTQAVIDSAVRAIIECQPYTMFSQARYDLWKVLPIDFDSREMTR